MRFHHGHCGIAIALFIVELSIALFVDDAFVRPYLSDVLVVPLVYCSVATFLEVRPVRLGVGVFAFACAVELAQLGDWVTVLGLADNRVARMSTRRPSRAHWQKSGSWLAQVNVSGHRSSAPHS